MNFLKRMTVLLMVTGMLFFSSTLLLLVLRVLDMTAVLTMLELISAEFNFRLIFGVIAVILLLANYILFSVFSVNIHRDKIIAFDNPSGRVSVSLSAMEEMIRRLLAKNPEIKESRVSILAARKGLQIKARLTLNSDVNIPGLTSRIQGAITRKINDMIGLDEKIDVAIFVGRILSQEPQLPEGERLESEESVEQNVPFHGFRG
jgi:uncharacterized alkaline shock family protein YloU